MKTKKTFEYENGVAFCYIEKGDNLFLGSACLHPDDADIASEITGCEIAEARANIDMMQWIKNNEIKPGLKALKHLYSCVSMSSNFNPKSYENRLLRRQIRKFENDLATVNNSIAEEKKFIKDYIAGKEKVRKILEFKKSEDNSI